MSETRRDRWGRYPGGGIVNRGGTCEHTDSVVAAMARLEQSLALSDDLTTPEMQALRNLIDVLEANAGSIPFAEHCLSDLPDNVRDWARRERTA